MQPCYMLDRLVSPCPLFSGLCGTPRCFCSYPPVGKGGVALFNQHIFNDLGVHDSQHRLPAIINPGRGRRGDIKQPQTVEVQGSADVHETKCIKKMLLHHQPCCSEDA